MFKKVLFLSIISIIATQAMDQPWEPDPLTVTVILKKGWMSNTEVTIPIDNATTVGAVASSATSKLAEMEYSSFSAPMALALDRCSGFIFYSEKMDDSWNMRRTINAYKTRVFNLIKK